jgi:hypothetical protein
LRKIEGKRSPNVTLLRSGTLIYLLDGSGWMVDKSKEIHIIGALCLSWEAQQSNQLTFLLKLGIHTRFHFDDNFAVIVVLVTQGIEGQVNGIVSTLISTSTVTVRIVTGTIVRGRTLGVGVDVGCIRTEVDSVVEALGKLGTSTSDMGSYLGGSTSVEEGGLERLDVTIYDLVGLDGRTLESFLPVIQELF